MNGILVIIGILLGLLLAIPERPIVPEQKIKLVPCVVVPEEEEDEFPEIDPSRTLEVRK